MSEPAITHDAEKRRYSLVVDGVEAYLTSERAAAGRMHITHTSVPDSVGRRGLGRKLVKRAVGDAIAAGDKVSSECWFASALMDKNAEWAPHLA